MIQFSTQSFILSQSVNLNQSSYLPVLDYELLPSFLQLPIIENDLFNSFQQFSYSTQSIARTDNTIEMLENTEWIIQCIASNPKGSENDLNYYWRKNGIIFKQGTGYESSFLIFSGSLCTESITGIYDVIVENVDGYVIAPSVNIKVYNTNSLSLFNQNIIQNSNGSEGLNEWFTDSDQITTYHFADLEYTYAKNNITSRSCEVDNVFFTFNDGHITNPTEVTNSIAYNNTIPNSGSSRFTHFFPRPAEILTPNNKNYESMFTESENFYFGRKRIDYDTTNNTNEVFLYQDIDISSIDSFIQGLVYGVEHVSLCGYVYLGAAISYYDSIRIFGTIEDFTTVKIEFYDINNIKINSAYESMDPRPDVIRSLDICDIREYILNEMSFNGCSVIKGYRIHLPFIPYGTKTLRITVSFKHEGIQSNIKNPEKYQWESFNVHKNSYALGLASRARNSNLIRQIERSMMYGIPRNLMTGMQLYCFVNNVDNRIFSPNQISMLTSSLSVNNNYIQ